MLTIMVTVCSGWIWRCSGSSGGLNYPTQLANLYGGANFITVTNLGVGGQTTPQMSADAVATIDALYDGGRVANIVVAWEIRNDLDASLGNQTQEAAYANYVAYCTARQAAGFRVVAVTVLPSLNIDNTERAWIRSQLSANWTSFADAFVDLDPITGLGADGDNLSTTYYNVDQIHLNNDGYALVADAVRDQIDAWITS